MPRGVYQHKKGYKRPPFSLAWRNRISLGLKGLFVGDANPAKRPEVRRKISEAMKGNTNWRFADRGEQWKAKIKAASRKGEEKAAWKGDGVSYRELHKWVRRHKGKPGKCIDCGKPALDWSNFDGKYRRRLEDFVPRCRSCHIKYDRDL